MEKKINLEKGLLIRSIFAGVVIGMGGFIYLLCENKIVGAFLFGFGLTAVCVLNLRLYTRDSFRVIADPNKKIPAKALELVIEFLGNMFGACLCGLMSLYNPKVQEKAVLLLEGKSDSFLYILVSSIFCGAVLCVAVEICRRGNTLIGALIGAPVFILCGFDHCVANMFFISAALDFSRYMLVIGALIGNTIGGFATYLMIKEYQLR